MTTSKFKLLKEQAEKACKAFEPANRLHTSINSISQLLNNFEDVRAFKLDVFTKKGGCHCVYIEDDKFKELFEQTLLNYMENMQNEFNKL